MNGDFGLSSERFLTLVTTLHQLALRDGAVPGLLAAAGAPLSAFQSWQDSQERTSENVQRLLAFAEAQGCMEILDAALGLAEAGPRAAAPAAARPGLRIEDVPISQLLKDEFMPVLRQLGNPEDLKRIAVTAFGNDVVANRVAWNRSIEAVAGELLSQAEGEGTVHKLVAELYRQRPGNRGVVTFVQNWFPMLYHDPVQTLTTFKLKAGVPIFQSIMVGRKKPLLDRSRIREVLSTLFTNPDNAPTVLTIDGPSRAGKSYLALLIEFLVNAGIRGAPETRPHTSGQHKFALLRPSNRGALHTVQDVAKDLFSQLGWKSRLPQQHKSDDGWAQEVIFEFRNQLALAEDVVWIVADRYWESPQAKPILDFFVGLVREATLMAARNKLRLILIDFPRKPLDDFIEDNGGVEGQFEHIELDWITPGHVKAFCCDVFIASHPRPNAPISADALFAAIERRVDHALNGAELQISWCTALKQELNSYW